MAINRALLILFCFLAISNTEATSKKYPPLGRSSFPKDFVFGAGSAAYQFEGGAFIDGKGDSIWDTFTHQHPEKIADRSNGTIADDMYHRYKGDVALMKTTGLDGFRFSISWSRVLPKGRVSGGVNALGVKYYNNLINEILANGMVPYVTIFHWDLPQALEDEYTGFRNKKIVDDFRDYAEFLFKTFGDRVKHWFTLNEPYTYSYFGYGTGTMAPGRCSNYVGTCTEGDSSTEPYIVTHHLILAHGAAVKLYREKYKPYQRGQIGVTLVTAWFVPTTATTTSERAARRALDFMFGWFLHPMTYGDYPMTLRALAGNRVPKFTAEETAMLQKSYDFLGVNYYTAFFASNVMFSNSINISMTTDNHANLTSVKDDGVAIGQSTALNWLYVYPKGMEDLMLYLKDNYGNPPIYITENGIAEANNDKLPVKEALKDNDRIEYLYSHLLYLSKAIKAGVNVKGYFMWAFMDDFEWDAGFTVRFGMYYIDYKDGLKRYPKYSAYWYKKFLQT
ncbi:Beta-glucosidase [Actinidia chinensis var. chinensis]|uniref:Beta-glucosidase n=1 Tax=Actinidia chinensis var. chinensis TaxID=1590841 RepID=A0A2R6QKU8_ACTCC|nr:Beta-glucosidase [Actinidia chinensis var. chinensis]